MTEVNEFMRENTSWFNKLIRNYPEIKNTIEFKKENSIHSENTTFKVNKLNLVIIAHSGDTVPLIPGHMVPLFS